MDSYIKGNYRRSIFKSDKGYVIGLFKVRETNDQTLEEYVNHTIARLFNAECNVFSGWTEEEIHLYLSLMEKYNNEITEQLFKAILLLKDINECYSFFEDIFTVRELQDVSQRLQVAQLLREGKSYQVISKETGASTATISRVNRCLVYGSGGYNKILDRLEKKQ